MKERKLSQVLVTFAVFVFVTTARADDRPKHTPEQIKEVEDFKATAPYGGGTVDFKREFSVADIRKAGFSIKSGGEDQIPIEATAPSWLWQVDQSVKEDLVRKAVNVANPSRDQTFKALHSIPTHSSLPRVTVEVLNKRVISIDLQYENVDQSALKEALSKRFGPSDIALDRRGHAVNGNVWSFPELSRRIELEGLRLTVESTTRNDDIAAAKSAKAKEAAKNLKLGF
jgi:hypothetical protein